MSVYVYIQTPWSSVVQSLPTDHGRLGYLGHLLLHLTSEQMLYVDWRPSRRHDRISSCRAEGFVELNISRPESRSVSDTKRRMFLMVVRQVFKTIYADCVPW